MLEPGAEAHEEGTADEGPGDDVEQALVGLAPPPGLDDEDERRDEHAQGDEDLVRGDGQVCAEDVAQGREHANESGTGRRGAQRTRRQSPPAPHRHPGMGATASALSSP